MLEKDPAIYKKKQGLRIRLARRMAGDLSQLEVAEKVSAELGYEVSDKKVSRWENGQDPSGREIAALAAVLNQPVGWLMGVEDDGMNAPIIHELSRWFRRPMEVFADSEMVEAAA